MTTQIGKSGVYFAVGTAGEQAPGAPSLHFYLLVHAETGAISGHTEQIHNVEPPFDRITIENVMGFIRPVETGKYTQIVSLRGQAVVGFRPPLIGSYVMPFDAHFAIDSDWNGVGGWNVGRWGVNNVPVVPQKVT